MRPSSSASTLLAAVCVRVCLGFAVLGLVPGTAFAQLAVTETEDVRIVYVDTQSFLVPYAARTFLNSLRFQKKLFDFTPFEKITVVLVDFQDSGGASTTTVPRNAVTVQAAPLSFAFETIAGNDRMNIIMNHELVHVAAIVRSAGCSAARWRRSPNSRSRLGTSI